MLAETLQLNYRRFVNFLGFSQGYFRRHNPIKNMIGQLTEMLKDILTINKKIKMSKYRLLYHQNQLRKMESLIAQNNDHNFLKGQKMNHVR